jgi:dTMP kinase
VFITFEGIEGSGKSTIIGRLKDHLLERGLGVTVTREPGGSRLGAALRTILLDVGSDDLTGKAELFLYLADRAQHVSTVIRPALTEDIIVVCDRYADSTVVYQGYGRGLDPNELHAFNDTAVDGLWPDVTFLLDLDPELGLRRAFARNLREDKASSEGRFEAESLAFHKRVREGYLTWAALNRQRYAVVDASREPDAVFADVRDRVDALLG